MKANNNYSANITYDHTSQQQQKCGVSITSRLKEQVQNCMDPNTNRTVVQALNNSSVKKLTERVEYMQKRVNDLEKQEKSVQNLTSILEDIDVSPQKMHCQSFMSGAGGYSINSSKNGQMHIIDHNITQRSPNRQPSSPFTKNYAKSNNNNNLYTNNNVHGNNQVNICSNNSLMCTQNSVNSGNFNCTLTQEKKNSVFKDILNRIQLLKSQNQSAVNRQLKYVEERYESNRHHYFDYMSEKDPVLLKIFIGLLYDELEKHIILEQSQQTTFKSRIEELEKSVLQRDTLVKQLKDEIQNKTVQLNSQNTKISRISQRIENLKWGLKESINMFELIVKDESQGNFYQEPVLGGLREVNKNIQNYTSSGAKCSNINNGNKKIMQVNSIFQEFQKLNELLIEFDPNGQENLDPRQSSFQKSYQQLGSINTDCYNGQNGSNQFESSSYKCNPQNNDSKPYQSESFAITRRSRNQSCQINNSLLAQQPTNNNSRNCTPTKVTLPQQHNNNILENQSSQQNRMSLNSKANNISSLIQKMGTSNKFEEIKNQLCELENEYRTMEGEMEDQMIKYKSLYQQCVKECEDLRAQAKELEFQNHGLNNQIQELQNKSKTSNDSLVYLKQEIIAMQSQNKQNASENEAREQAYQERIRETETEVGKLRLKLKDLENEIAGSKGQHQIALENNQKELERWKVKHDQSETQNYSLKKELEECLSLLNSGKQNMENLKQIIEKKEQEKTDLANQLSKCENQLYLKNKEVDTLNATYCDIQLKLQQYELEQQNQLTEQIKQKQDKVLEKLIFLVESKQVNQEIDHAVKEDAKHTFGEKMVIFFELVQQKFTEDEQANKEFNDRFKELLSSKIVSLEDIKFLCNTILHVCEIFARQSNSKIPTDVLVLREELEKNRQTIQEKLAEVCQENAIFREELHKLNLNDVLFAGDLSNIDIPKNFNINTSVNFKELAEDEESRLSLPERVAIQDLRAENEQLKQKIETMILEASSFKSQINLLRASVQQNDDSRLPPTRCSINGNGGDKSFNNNNCSLDRVSRSSQKKSVKTDRTKCLKEYEESQVSTVTSAGINQSIIQQSQMHISGSQNVECDDYLQFLFLQASSLEQLLQNQN